MQNQIRARLEKLTWKT